MKVKFLNQQYQKGNPNAKKASEREYWSTSYITDLPIETLTKQADIEIERFVEEHFNSTTYRIERNGMLRLWQFTVTTTEEVTEWEIIEETAEERAAKHKPLVDEWWETQGSLDDKYYGGDWEIEEIEERDNGNTLAILLYSSNLDGIANPYQEEILKKQPDGMWAWIEQTEN